MLIVDDSWPDLFATSIRSAACMQTLSHEQQYPNPNQKYKGNAKFKLKTFNFNKKDDKTRMFEVYVLGLGFLAGGADPNQVQERSGHESSTNSSLAMTLEVARCTPFVTETEYPVRFQGRSSVSNLNA